MRSAKIHSISESEHFVDYAEMPSFDWVERTNEYIRKAHKWENAILVLGAAVLLWLTWLGVGR